MFFIEFLYFSNVVNATKPTNILGGMWWDNRCGASRGNRLHASRPPSMNCICTDASLLSPRQTLNRNLTLCPHVGNYLGHAPHTNASSIKQKLPTTDSNKKKVIGFPKFISRIPTLKKTVNTRSTFGREESEKNGSWATIRQVSST